MSYTKLIEQYSPLLYIRQYRDLLKNHLNINDYDNINNKIQLIKIINNIIFENNYYECVYKYALAKEFINDQYIGAFEVRVKNSRVDFLIINSNTISFEIKSKKDNLNRLKKQIDTYGNVFEYNIVAIDESHLRKTIPLLPDHYGIWVYDNKNNRYIYKSPQYSPFLNSQEQLRLMNKKELKRPFNIIDIQEIMYNNDMYKINNVMKQTLKNRYEKKWAFVQDHWDNIIPIDIQFFFNTNVPPDIIYNVNY